MSRARDFADLAAAYSDGALSNRNMIINGAMNICQRGAAHSGAFTTSQSGYFLDMWSFAGLIVIITSGLFVIKREYYMKNSK